MSVYPRNLSAFLNRLSGYNKNNIKINVLGSSSANQGDTIQVDLPTNSIVDLSSLAWSFLVTYGNPGTGKTNDLPQMAEAHIARLAVEVNGQTLVNIQNYNLLFQMLLNMTATEDYQRQRMVAQSDADVPELAAASGTLDRAFVVDTWLGFLGSAKPNFLDTSLLGNVRITITLAGPEIICGDGGARTYAISQQHFSCDVISISDGIYDAMIDQMLASGAPIEVPFKNYFNFTQEATTYAHTLNFHVASQSVDRLWATCRRATHSDADAGKIAVAGYSFPCPAHMPQYTNMTAGNGGHFQFQVNNTLYPNWTSEHPRDWWQHTKLAVGDQGNMLAGAIPHNFVQYLDNFFVFSCQLEHRTDGDERFVSGIDTRGAAASCFFKCSALTGGQPTLTGTTTAYLADNQAVVFAECTSSLKIMAGKVLEVVQ
jgi:hypothetical protein